MIKVIKTGINVSRVVEQLKKNPQDWDHQKNLKDSQSLVDRGFADLPISALQLIMGSVKHKDDFVGDSETNIKTPAYAHHSESERSYASTLRMLTFKDVVFFHSILMRL